MDNGLCLLAPNAGVGGESIGALAATLTIGSLLICLYLIKKTRIRTGLFALALVLGASTSLQLMPQIASAATNCLASKPDSSVGLPGQVQRFNVLNNDTPSAGARFVGASLRLALPDSPVAGSTLSGDRLSVSAPTEGAYQASAVGEDGTISFTPEANFRGVARGVRYTVEDTAGNTTGSIYTPRVTETVAGCTEDSSGATELATKELTLELFSDEEVTGKESSTSLLKTMGNKWTSVASSVNGTKLVAASSTTGDGSVYTSTDSGVTWTKRLAAGERDWTSVATSADGTRLAAVAWNESIYTSIDSGASWTEQTTAGARRWKTITSSADGTKLAAIAWENSIYTSTDGGANWTEQTTAGARRWTSITSSADGTKLTASAFESSIVTSTDSGTTWVDQPGSGWRYWANVVSSADGSTLIATENGGYVYISTDAGVNWVQQVSLGTSSWASSALSSDGTKMVIAGYGGYIQTSTDTGANWVVQAAPGQRDWDSVAASADGSKYVAIDAYIHTSADSGASWQTHLNKLPYDENGIDLITSTPEIDTVIDRSNSEGWMASYDPATDIFKLTVTDGDKFLTAYPQAYDLGASAYLVIDYVIRTTPGCGYQGYGSIEISSRNGLG